MSRGVYKDITGERFGKLVVLDRKAGKKYKVVVRCDCGNEKEVWKNDLTQGHTKSCGCTKKARSISRVLNSNPQENAGYVLEHKSFENKERIIDINKIYKQAYEISSKPKRSKRNSSGVVGVSWNKRKHKWESYIGFKGSFIRLGDYQIFDHAVRARKEAEELLFAPTIINMRRKTS